MKKSLLTKCLIVSFLFLTLIFSSKAQARAQEWEYDQTEWAADEEFDEDGCGDGYMDINGDGYCEETNDNGCPTGYVDVGGYCEEAGSDASFMQGVYDAGSYQNCVGYCESIGDSGDCYTACGEQYDATGDAGNGSGSGYECEEGYQEDPKDATSCIPICENSGQYYSSYYDSCVGGKGSACLTDDDCGGGLSCNSSNSCESNIWGRTSDVTTGWFGDRVSQTTLNREITTSGGTRIPAGSDVMSDGSVRLPSGAIMPAGTVSGNALNELFPDINTGGSGGVFGGLYGDGSGGNGGSGGGGSYGGGGSDYGFPGTPAGVAGAAGCGAGFEKIGGVCFPSKSITGLSDAPIALIITNLFFWLMALFTTLAVGAFVVSGIQYMTSAGDSSQAETAKKNAKWATIGIIVGFSGFIIVKAIATALSGQATLF